MAVRLAKTFRKPSIAEWTQTRQRSETRLAPVVCSSTQISEKPNDDFEGLHAASRHAEILAADSPFPMMTWKRSTSRTKSRTIDLMNAVGRNWRLSNRTSRERPQSSENVVERSRSSATSTAGVNLKTNHVPAARTEPQRIGSNKSDFDAGVAGCRVHRSDESFQEELASAGWSLCVSAVIVGARGCEPRR